MNFPIRDFTNQFISSSYQDVLQQYLLTNTLYVLDGLGNVVFTIPSSSYGQNILMSDATSSMSVSSSISSITSLTSDFSLLSGNSITSTTTSYILMPIKSGIVDSSSFGGNPLSSSVVFNNIFADNNYSITITGDSDRVWSIKNRSSGSFIINSNQITPLTGSTYWQAIYRGEYN